MDESLETIRVLKTRGMTDFQIGGILGVAGSRIKYLRQKHGIVSPPPKLTGKSEHSDGWPAVMDPQTRDRRWKRYFKKIGHDHSHDDLRFPSTGRVMMQPDRSHCHGLGATSLTAMESF